MARGVVLGLWGIRHSLFSLDTSVFRTGMHLYFIKVYIFLKHLLKTLWHYFQDFLFDSLITIHVNKRPYRQMKSPFASISLIHM